MKEAVRRLGRWQVQRALGRDQFGSYHAAVRDDDVRATLYRPAGEIADGAALARLIAMHRRLAGRDVPRIAGVIAFRAIEHDGDQPLVLGDAVGDALVSLQRGRRPDPGQIRAVGAALAAALIALHDRGVVHGGLELDHALWAPDQAPGLLGAGVAGLAAGYTARPDGDVVGLGRLLCALVASWPRRATGVASAEELRTVELIRRIADPGAGLAMPQVHALLAGGDSPQVARGWAEPPPEMPTAAMPAPRPETVPGEATAAMPAPGPETLGSTPGSTAEAMAAPTAVSPSPAPGGQLGRYRILTRLGCGGMGEVFLAEDPALRRGVAIKRIRPALQRDAVFRARLRREAQLAALLGHRAIVQVFDLVSDDDIDHVVMEYVPGPSLHALLAGQPMPVAEAMRIAAELADGLACAHQHGIVHRDLKLENVLIGTDGQPKIVDFGIARRTAVAGDSHEAVTRDGFMVGTSRAMSPEQIQCREVDARSDLFSFGVLLYELVTGATPFAASNEALTMLRVLNERHVPARDAMPGVPAALSALIDHLLDKAPARRPESARAVRDRLRRMLDGSEPAAPPRAIGEPLDPTGVAPRDQASQIARGERREVAVACIDLIAASATGDELTDRELLADALPAFRIRAKEIIARSGGVLTSALAHRFVICFGHARPDERAVRRAVLAGRALLVAAAELRCTDPVHAGAQFTATGAIHTGIAVVRGDGDELLLGVTLDIALRLLHLGGAGELWLSEPAARAVEAEFQLERLATPAGVPAARRFVRSTVASGSAEYGRPLTPRDREPPPAIVADAPRPLRRPRASEPPVRPQSSRIQAPFVLAEIRALRASIFKRSPEIQSALAIADKVEHCYDLRRNDLFIPAGETWCAILEPFAATVLTGVLLRIGYEIFPQYVSILGIAAPDVRTAMDLRQPTDLVRVICDAYSKCVIGSDAGTLTTTIDGSRATVTDTTIIPCQLQIGVFLGAGKLTGLFRDTALTEKRCRGRGDPVCSYELAF